jgi:hypothetical protein
MKETFYFSHDYNSREDEKIRELIFKHGWAGYGVFWAIVEMLYQNDGFMRTHCERIAFDLRTESELIKSVLHDFDLFVVEDDKFWSESILKRLDKRNEKSEKARKSAMKRWSNKGNDANADANALRKECEGNAIKESKVKESKVKEKSGFDLNFVKSDFKEMVEKFIDHRIKMNAAFKSTYEIKNFHDKLMQLSEFKKDVAQKIIDEAIQNNWKTVFPLKNEGKPQTKIINGRIAHDSDFQPNH